MKDFISAFRKFPAKFIYFSVLAIFVGLIGSVIFVLAKVAAEDTAPPKNVVVSNVTDQSVTVSWMTEKPVAGSVLVSQADSWNILHELGKQRFWDDRDVRYDKVGKHYVHHVTIDGLDENTKYYYRISTGYRRYALDIDGNKLPDMETGPVLEALYTPDPIYGKIFDNNGNPVSEEVLFYVQLRNVNGDWSTVLSGMINNEGGWTVDRANARTADFSDLFSSAGGGDIAILNAAGYSLTGVYLGEGKLEIPFGQDRPAANLFLSEKIAVAMDFNEPTKYSEKMPIGNKLINLPNFSFVNKVVAQTCTPGAYDRKCTGNQAGCASDAGEAEVKQCKADGSGYGAPWGECSTACDIQEEEGGPIIVSISRIADGYGCSCQGQDWACRDKIIRNWSDNHTDEVSEAGTYIVGDAQCKPAAVSPAPSTPAPDDTCSGYAVNTWMCAEIGPKNEQGRYNCGQYKKSNGTCSWNAWKQGDTANPAGCGNCRPTEEAAAAPDEQEVSVDKLRAIYEAGKALISQMRETEPGNEGISDFVEWGLLEIDNIYKKAKPGIAQKEIDAISGELGTKIGEISAIYNSYLKWKESCATNCTFKTWDDQGRPGEQERERSFEEISNLVNERIAAKNAEITVDEKNAIRTVAHANIDKSEAELIAMIDAEIDKYVQLGELKEISGNQVCDSPNGCVCNEGQIGEGYNCSGKGINGTLCINMATKCISNYCDLITQKCTDVPEGTGTVNFDFTISGHPQGKAIPTLKFILINTDTGVKIAEKDVIQDEGRRRTTVTGLDLNSNYTATINGSDGEVNWHYAHTFKLTETAQDITGTVSAESIVTTGTVSITINCDIEVRLGVTMYPTDLNITLKDSDGEIVGQSTATGKDQYKAIFTNIAPGSYTVSVNKNECGNQHKPYSWEKTESITVNSTGNDQTFRIGVPTLECDLTLINRYNKWSPGCNADEKRTIPCGYENWVDEGMQETYPAPSVDIGGAPVGETSMNNLLDKFGGLLKGIFSKAEAAEPPVIEGSGVYQFTIEGLEVTTPPVRIYTYGDETVEIKVFDDVNKNGIKDEGEDYLDVSALSIKIDKLSSVELFRLNKGWNLVSFPITTFVDDNGNGICDDGEEGFATAKGLIEEIINQGGYATTVSAYNTGQWNTYVERAGESKSNDFYIIPGDAYFIRVYTPITLSVSGNKYADSVPVNLTSGWNLKGIIAPNNYHTAESVIDSINESVEGAEADIVTQYIRGGYDNFIKTNGDVFGFDYGVENKTGYFIRLKAGSGLWDPRYAKLSE